MAHATEARCPARPERVHGPSGDSATASSRLANPDVRWPQTVRRLRHRCTSGPALWTDACVRVAGGSEIRGRSRLPESALRDGLAARNVFGDQAEGFVTRTARTRTALTASMGRSNPSEREPS